MKRVTYTHLVFWVNALEHFFKGNVSLRHKKNTEKKPGDIPSMK